MSRYEELGFFDFEDFVEELNEEDLFCVNGGGCGGSSYSYTPSYSGGCSGGGAVTLYNTSSVSTCGCAFLHTPIKQICTVPTKDHCDIYAWNLAIDNGLDPRKGLQSVLDLNYATVDQMYNMYYKGKTHSFSSVSAGKKGVLVYDWGGTSSEKDHIKYVEISQDGKGYTQYKTYGIETPVPIYKTFKDSPTASADTSNGSSVVFIPLN